MSEQFSFLLDMLDLTKNPQAANLSKDMQQFAKMFSTNKIKSTRTQPNKENIGSVYRIFNIPQCNKLLSRENLPTHSK